MRHGIGKCLRSRGDEEVVKIAGGLDADLRRSKHGFEIGRRSSNRRPVSDIGDREIADDLIGAVIVGVFEGHREGWCRLVVEGAGCPARRANP